MSALSKSNGPLKKGTSISDITSQTGIAIGRGYEDHVAVMAVQPDSAALIAKPDIEEAPTTENLDQIIDGSSLPPETKSETKQNLHNGLLTELNKGERANVIVIKQQFARLTSAIPDIGDPLRLFIENHVNVPKAIKIWTKLFD